MITILHGEHLVASRNELAKRLAAYAEQGFAVHRLDAKKLERPALESALGTHELFTPKTVVVIEELFSLPKSKRKDELIGMLTTGSVDLLLWEKKLLTATQLKSFPTAEVKAFKTSSSVFVWVDSLKPDNAVKMLQLLKQACEQDGAEMCFAMLCRQIRLLLQVKDGGQLKVAPFMVGKYKAQAALLDLQELVRLHAKLLQIDLEQKTSGSAQTLQDTLYDLMLGISARSI